LSHKAIQGYLSLAKELQGRKVIQVLETKMYILPSSFFKKISGRLQVLQVSRMFQVKQSYQEKSNKGTERTLQALQSEVRGF